MKIKGKLRIKWAVIWKRDKTILGLYRMKFSDILTIEANETTGDNNIVEVCAIFNTKKQAESWRGKNKDWETIKISLLF